MLDPILALVMLATPAPPETLVVPLEQVVVTGTRTKESVLRAPAAITVVDRRSFRDSRGISLEDALSRVPGVFAQSRSGAQDVRITIRGYGARGNGERSNVGNMRGIRVMTDGFSLTEPDGRTSLDLVDLGAVDEVEVTRSNVSSLYGNASGGVVNLRTRLDFADPFVEAGARGGSFGYHRETARTGLVLGPARGTVTLSSSTFDGWREHSASSGTFAQFRLTTLLDPRTRLGVLVDGASTMNRFPGALDDAGLAANPRAANDSFVVRDERRFNRVGRVGLTLGHALSTERDLSISAFVEPKALQRSERARFRDFTRYHVGGSATYEHRLAPAEGWRARLAAGADEAFQDGSILFYNLAPGGGRSTTIRANKREAANGAGGFLEGELQWHERWALRASARHDVLWYVSEDRLEPQLNADKTFRRWTPKGSLSYRTDHHTLYGALGGGIEAPAFNEIDPPAPFDTLTSLNPFLEPMRSLTWELGAKGDLGQSRLGRLRYDVALYWIEVRDEIVPFDGGAYFLTAGHSRRRGVELGLDWIPGPPVLIEGALTLSNNRYLEYRNELGDFSGRRTAGLPEITGSLEAQVRLPAGIRARGSVEHVGRYFADDANQAEVPAHTLLGARIARTTLLESSTLEAFIAGDNLTDERHVASAFINGVNGQFFEPGLPRNWSAGVTLRWR